MQNEIAPESLLARMDRLARADEDYGFGDFATVLREAAAEIERLEAENAALARVRAFLDAIEGEAGLSCTDVDRLCGIAHGRTDLPLHPARTQPGGE